MGKGQFQGGLVTDRVAAREVTRRGVRTRGPHTAVGSVQDVRGGWVPAPAAVKEGRWKSKPKG
jgi:hypothetical protein